MSRFDRFMVHVDVGTDEKLAQLTDVERLCHIAGVLAVAAKSPVRGRLLVGDREATPREIAKRADVSVRVARSTMDKLIDVGVLTRDDDLDCWRVHNWERFNPDPKQDRTNAERQARYRDRRVTLRNAPSNAPRNALRSISDAGWAQFVSILEGKAECAGSRVVKVNPRNTSQACSGCGQIVAKGLAVRWHRCECGTSLDRDHNAALNILRAGQALRGGDPVVA